MLRSTNLRKAMFAAGVLASLGFGSTQVFATPAQTPTDGSFCNDNVCTAVCITKGYQYGICYTHSGCVCYRLYE